MNRSIFAPLFLVLVTAACSGKLSSPTAPSVEGAAPRAALAVSPAGSGPRVAGAVNLAGCLRRTSDPACFSGARAVVHGTAADDGSIPSPMNLAAWASGTSVTLTWTPPAGDPVMAYVLEAGSAPGLADLADIILDSSTTSFSATGVGAGTYFVRVRAETAAGMSPPSNEAVLTVGGDCTSAPNAPSGLTATASGSSVTLAWIAGVGGCAPSGYVVEAGSMSGASDIATIATGNAATTFAASDVASGTYYVRVRAANAAGASDPSNEAVLTVASSGMSPGSRWLRR